TDLVDEEARADDADGEGPNTDARKFTRFCRGKPEFGCPRVDQKHTRDESECGGHQGDEASPKKPKIFVFHDGSGGGPRRRTGRDAAVRRGSLRRPGRLRSPYGSCRDAASVAA